ncbi:YwiC-like family protein [Actinobacillus genomosp. 2]|uniref:YwiC-like family protein n=1 Tax=Actinobacillus genomosp. 2 TaxID=230709 RepID=UPI0024417607|nr:YwiC-like family protein [Actinobacillus genomosp. 2]WGE32255.1 YwiC-like family protein [Actinobacillus genomosp. 2]
MLKDKPVISNQHGALVMAFVPFLYAGFKSGFSYQHIWFALSWLFLYLFSYPYLALFSKKPTARNKKWAMIYFVLSLGFALPVIMDKPNILQFLLIILPLGLVQTYYAKQKDERHLNNDLAGILTFGVIGMASGYLMSMEYDWAILIHPTLFFVATTFYVKSMVRERKNPLFMELSLGLHLLLAMIYWWLGYHWLYFAYLIGFMRAALVPSFGLNVKQIGMLEFITVFIFFICLIYSP